MDKIKTVKLKEIDGSISENSYHFSVDAKYVDMKNKANVQDTIGEIDLATEDNIATQLKELNNNIKDVVRKNEIINNLNNESIDKPLSAKQGNVLNKKIVENNFYDEITYTKKRYYDTDCYITTIPLKDNDNNQIDIFVGYGNGKTPTEYARDENTTLTINATLNIARPEFSMVGRIPSVISNGEIIRSYDENSTLPDCYEYIGFKADRSVVSYKVNNTTAQDMINDGVINAFDSFYRLINNGTLVDLTTIHPTTGDEVTTDLHPRQCLGIKDDKTIIILTTEGRGSLNRGLTSEETQEILSTLECVDAWNLDGGGSTSTTIKGVKINQNYDDDGTTDRMIPYTLNVKKNISNQNIADIYSFIGKNNQNIFDLLMPVYRSYNISDLSGKDCNNLIGKIYFGYGNSMTNKPGTNNGWFINIPHGNPEQKNLYNKQIFIYRDFNKHYQREMINGVWKDWELINQNINVKIVTKRSDTGNSITTDDNYQPIILEALSGNELGERLVTLDTDDTSTKITVNRSCKIKITCNIDFSSNSSSEKFIRVTKNDVNVDTSFMKYNIDSGKTGLLYSCDFISVTPNDYLKVTMRGKQGDGIYRGYIYIESI